MTHIRLRASWLLAFAGLTALALSPLNAQDDVQLPEGVRQMASVEGMTEYLLESNGLHILLFPDASKPTITVNVTYKVGSRHEGYGETGMAHLLEHLVFKGTPDHPNIPQELTEHGARPNGTTWYDRTNYFETFSATEENLRWALDMEADRMVNSFISAEDLESEMTVVRNEFESGENFPSSVLQKRLTATAYLWHNYGKSTIGARADIENVPIDRLQAFYRKYYQPDNAVLVVAGKIDPSETLEMIVEYFGRIPKPERELITTYTREPVQDGERFVELERTGDVQVVQALYHVCPAPHADFAPVAVLLELLTAEPSGRLYTSLVESELATSQYGFAAPLAEPSYVLFSADVLKEKDLAAAEEAMLATIDDLKNNPPTEEEVERAKKRLVKNFELFLRNSDQVGLAMSTYIAQGDWRLAFIYRDRLKAVKPEMVQKVAEKYFKPSNRTIGRFLPTENPDRAEIPNEVDIASLVEGYTGGEAIAQGEAFDPSPENIESRTQKGRVENNVEYALLPKETRGDAVRARMSMRWGDLESLQGKRLAASFAASMLDKGSEKYSRQEIEDKLDALNARVQIYGSARSGGVNIESERDLLPEVFDFVGELFRTPTFPEEEFEKLKKERLAGLEESRSEPTAIASREFSRRLNPYGPEDPRYRPTIDEEIKAIEALTLEEVRSFYDKFYGTNEGTIGVVGDFDPESVIAALDRNFKGWTSEMDYERVTDDFFDVPGDNIEFETPDKANAFFLAGQNLPVGTNHPDYPALVLGNYMLGGGFLNSRLATRIRQEEGLSYGVGSGYYGDSNDEKGTFQAYAIYAPENKEALETAFREEIEKVRTDGFTEEEVAAAKSGWLQSQEVNRAQDAALAGKLGSNLFLKRTMEWDAQLEANIDALTPEQINEAMRRYIDLEKMIFVKAGDFANAKPSKP